MGTLVYGIRYTFPEYLCTFLVAGGVSIFALLKVMIMSTSYMFFFFFWISNPILLKRKKDGSTRDYTDNS